MNKLPTKPVYVISGLLLVIGLPLFAFQVKSNPQGNLLCYTINSSGRVENLNSLCKPGKAVNTGNNREPDSAKIAMVKQGRKLLWDKHYQEAVDVFTAAVNRYPNYAEAYMGRAYSNYSLGANGDTVITDLRNAEAAYRQRQQPEYADNISRLIQQYRREKLGLQ
jgi:hypothetical protein